MTLFSFLDPYANHPLAQKVLLLNHCIIVCNNVYRQFKSNFKKDDETPLIAGIALCLAMGLGGGILVALLQGSAQLFVTDELWLIMLSAIWSLIAFDFTGIIHFLTGNALVELVTYLVEGYFVGGIIAAVTNGAATSYPESNVAPLLLGTLAAIGGGIVFPVCWNLYVGSQKPQLSTLLTKPGFMVYYSILAATFFYLAEVKKVIPVISIPYEGQNIVVTPTEAVRLLIMFEFGVQIKLLPMITSLFTSSKKEKSSGKAQQQPSSRRNRHNNRKSSKPKND